MTGVSREIGKRRAAAMALVVLLLLAGGAAAQEPAISAQVDRPQIAVGESAVLSIEVTGTQDAAAPDVVAIDGLGLRYAGPSTQMRLENGRMSSSITHRYQVIGRRPGQFTLGPFEVAVGGTTLRSEPIALQVLPAGAAPDPAAAPQLQIEARLAKANPFAGERVTLTIRVLIPNGVRVDDLQFPTVEAQAIAVGDMPQPAQRDERINGRPYRVLYFDTHVTPLAAVASDLVVAMGMNVIEARRGRGGMFGMFDDMLGERRPVELRSAPIAFAPRALPPGEPAGFSGAVGNFDLELAASPRAVNAGDPVTLRIAVTGEGDFSKVHPPRFAPVQGFRVYDPVAVKDAGPGRRAVEQVVIPQSPDADELPALAFSFFDPKSETYRTVHRGPIALQVNAASNVPVGVVAEGESGAAERAPGPLGRDIVYIKNEPGDWRGAGTSPLTGWWFWLINALPVAVCTALGWRQRRAGLLAANPALRRFREAEGKARGALAVLSANGSDGAALLDGLSRALGEYFAAKLGMPPGAVEAAAVRRALHSAGYDDDLGRDAEQLIGSLEGLRYAPGGNADGRAELVRRAEALVDAIEKRRDVTEKLARALVALLALASLLAMAPRWAVAADDVADGPEAKFFAGNHAYADGRYAEAIAHYEAALQTGAETGALHFNLGNARFKSGDAAGALAGYLRAERLLPRDPDVAANLSFARESLELGAEPDPLWRRIAFAPAYRATESELALAVTALWWILGAALAAGFMMPRLREPLRWVVRGSGLVAVAVALFLAYRHQALELRGTALVTAAGATVRFEPSASGTAHFEAPPGTMLAVSDQRDGWSQVTRRDGRRGWVATDAITLLR